MGLLGPTPTFKNIRVGIEIELENLQPFPSKVPNTFAIVADHSLKELGIELVSVPIKVQYLEVELTRLYQGIGDNWKASSRCSTHIHLNVRDMTIDELYKLHLLYLIFERSLYRYSGDRWNNIFCIPLHHSMDISYTLQQLNRGYFHTTNKYLGFNTCPISGNDGSNKYGTIEFRHMTGGRTPKDIILWCNLIISLKLASKKLTTSDLEVHIITMRTTSGYYWLVKEVFGKWANLLTDQPTFKEDVEECITKTKGHLQLVLGSKPC